jgi:hypothetical protein
MYRLDSPKPICLYGPYLYYSSEQKFLYLFLSSIYFSQYSEQNRATSKIRVKNIWPYHVIIHVIHRLSGGPRNTCLHTPTYLRCLECPTLMMHCCCKYSSPFLSAALCSNTISCLVAMPINVFRLGIVRPSHITAPLDVTEIECMSQVTLSLAEATCRIVCFKLWVWGQFTKICRNFPLVPGRSQGGRTYTSFWHMRHTCLHGHCTLLPDLLVLSNNLFISNSYFNP